MADDTQVLLAFCQEHWTQARHIENQRATISNLIIVVASIIVAFVSQQGLSLQMLPLTILLIILGLFGAFITEKLYELFHFHHDKVRYWQKRINELNPNARLDELEKEANREHNNRYSRMRSIRLHYLWVLLHSAVVLVGTVLSILIFL